jgi:CDP-diacylglycerol--glycerol-3-phosphate 3-phosphatidyltransferase
MFREVFVSGLREFLGAQAGLLKVTRLAKWKTTAQMIAIAVLFAKGAFEHFLIEQTLGMSEDIVAGILDGSIPDAVGLRWKALGWDISWYGGIALLWLAAVLTAVTGWDYFNKSLPLLRDKS